MWILFPSSKTWAVPSAGPLYVFSRVIYSNWDIIESFMNSGEKIRPQELLASLLVFRLISITIVTNPNRNSMFNIPRKNKYFKLIPNLVELNLVYLLLTLNSFWLLIKEWLTTWKHRCVWYFNRKIKSCPVLSQTITIRILSTWEKPLFPQEKKTQTKSNKMKNTKDKRSQSVCIVHQTPNASCLTLFAFGTTISFMFE